MISSVRACKYVIHIFRDPVHYVCCHTCTMHAMSMSIALLSLAMVATFHRPCTKWVTLIDRLSAPPWCQKTAKHVRTRRHALKRIARRFENVVGEVACDWVCCSKAVFLEYVRCVELTLDRNNKRSSCSSPLIAIDRPIARPCSARSPIVIDDDEPAGAPDRGQPKVLQLVILPIKIGCEYCRDVKPVCWTSVECMRCGRVIPAAA